MFLCTQFKKWNFFFQVASSAINNQLLKYGAKDHFFRAVLCHMCRDIQDAEIVLKRYEDMFPVFTDARECKLVKVSSTRITETVLVLAVVGV